MFEQRREINQTEDAGWNRGGKTQSTGPGGEEALSKEGGRGQCGGNRRLVPSDWPWGRSLGGTAGFGVRVTR